MSRALLDINVLLALLDSDHLDHARADTWLNDEIDTGWASCAITQNGFIRIVSQPRYPSPIPPAQAIELLAHACTTHHHAFWSCNIDRSRLHGPRQVTGAYLLALACANEGRSVTFDRSVATSAVLGASAHQLVVI